MSYETLARNLGGTDMFFLGVSMGVMEEVAMRGSSGECVGRRTGAAMESCRHGRGWARGQFGGKGRVHGGRMDRVLHSRPLVPGGAFRRGM